MAAPITRGAFSPLNSPDLFNVFVEKGLELPLEYVLWSNISTMPWNSVTNRQVTGLGTVPDKPEGTRFPTRSPLLGPSKAHTADPRGMAVEITFEGFRDELYGYHRQHVASMRKSANNRLETDAHQVLNRAFNTSYTGFTASKSLCSTSQTTLAGGTWANRPSPDIGLSQAFVQAGIKAFHAMPDEQGLPQLMSPSFLITRYDNLFTAREVLGSSGKPLSANNEFNSIIQEDLSYMVSHYLTSTTAVFLLAAQGVHDLQFGVRDPLMFNTFDDPYTMNTVATVYFRNTESYFDSPRGVYGSTG